MQYNEFSDHAGLQVNFLSKPINLSKKEDSLLNDKYIKFDSGNVNSFTECLSNNEQILQAFILDIENTEISVDHIVQNSVDFMQNKCF